MVSSLLSLSMARLALRSGAPAPCCLVFSLPAGGVAAFSCLALDLRAFGDRGGSASPARAARAKARLSMALFGHPVPRGLPALGAWCARFASRASRGAPPPWEPSWRLIDMSGLAGDPGNPCRLLIALGNEEPSLELALARVERREASALALLAPLGAFALRRGALNLGGALGSGSGSAAFYPHGLGGLAREARQALEARAESLSLGSACPAAPAGPPRRERAL